VKVWEERYGGAGRSRPPHLVWWAQFQAQLMAKFLTLWALLECFFLHLHIIFLHLH